ncbi:MAG TPA: AI-2E family transporter [Gemmata sp.]
MPDRPEMGRTEFTRRVLIVAGIALLTVALVTVFVRAADVFFLLFAAVLLAILLRTAAGAVARRTGIGPRWCLALVVTALVGLAAGTVVAAEATVADQVNRFATELPKSLGRARDTVRQYPWGREAIQHVPTVDDALSANGGVTAGVTTFFSTTLGVLGNVVVLVFLTLYLAASPQAYVGGLLALVPPARRDRAGAVLAAVGFHLRWWLIGRLIAMAAVAVIVGAGLWAVGVPQFLILGLVAGLLTAIPFLGPILGAIPGLLLALLQGPAVALGALAVYVGAQALENYLITPLVQKRTVALPPVLTIMAVVLAGALSGVLGLVVATPLVVTILVAVKMLYIEDVLGNRCDVPGARRAAN